MRFTGVKILVTRPAHQANHLCQLLETMGGQPIRLPTIEIVPLANNQALHDCCAQLHQFDIAIFISVNAVEIAMPTLFNVINRLPQLKLAAVGKRTVEALKMWNLTALCAAPPFNSESLLLLPELQTVNTQQIVIFRGEGGRELLADTLRQRGATVTYINLYRRVQPKTLPEPVEGKNLEKPLSELIEGIQPVDIIIITSSESLRNLIKMFGQANWILHTPFVLMSERLVAEARDLGIQAPLFIAPHASDEGLLAAVLQWQANRLNPTVSSS